MPRIREYNNPISGLEVSGAGARATALGGEYAGRTLASERIQPAVSRLGDAAADRYEQFIVAPELSKGAALFAQYQNELTQKWNKQAKETDPNDATLGQRFREWDIEPTYEKFISGFSTGEGKKWAEAQVANSRNHFNQKITADMSTRAGQAVLQNHDTMKNALSTMVMNDPSTFNQAIKSSDDALQALIKNNPMLDATTAGAITTKAQRDLKTELAKAWIIGTARVNPDAAEKAINEGKFKDYLTATEAKSALAFAETQRRLVRQDQELARRNEEREKQKISDTKESEYYKQVYREDGTIGVTTQQIAADDTLEMNAKRRLIASVNAEVNKPEVNSATSQYNSADLFRRMYSPNSEDERITSTTPIVQARIDRKINRTDFAELMQRFNEATSPEGQKLTAARQQVIRAIGPSIDKDMFAIGGSQDYNKQVQFLKWSQAVDRKIDEFRKAGKSWGPLFDASSPEFVGRPDFVGQFVTDFKTRIESQFGGLGKPVLKKVDDRVSNDPPIPQAIRQQYPTAKWDNGRIIAWDPEKRLWGVIAGEGE